MLNKAAYNSFFDLFAVHLKTIDHLNLKLLCFIGMLQVLRFEFLKFRILEILNFHPCIVMLHFRFSQQLL